MSNVFEKVLDTYVYSYEMDYHGYYPPAFLFRSLNGGFFRVLGNNGLRMVDIRSKINATHMVGMLDMQVMGDISVLATDRESIELYAKPISRTKGVFRNEVYLVKDGQALASLEGVTMIVDVATRRVIPTEQVLERMERPYYPITAPVPKRLCLPEEMELWREIEVRYGDCDMNKHLNTTRYIEYICETLGFWKGPRKRMSRLQIEFNRECLAEDVLQIYVTEAETGYYIKGVKKAGEPAFKAYCELTEVEHE